MAVKGEDATQRRPTWPSAPIDPRHVDLSYYPPADELMLYFPGRRHGGVCDPINEPGGGDVAIVVDDDTNEIVGIQVIPLLVGAVQQHPRWAILAWGSLTEFRYEDHTFRSEVAAFVAEVADLFARYWTPAPPWEEQLANLPRAARPAGDHGDEPG